MSEKKSIGFPDSGRAAQDAPTRPSPLQKLPRQGRIDHELAIISAHHERISIAIQLFWGHKECVDYLQQLIFSDGYGLGRARIGFKREVLSALINLAALHEVQQA